MQRRNEHRAKKWEPVFGYQRCAQIARLCHLQKSLAAMGLATVAPIVYTIDRVQSARVPHRHSSEKTS